MKKNIFVLGATGLIGQDLLAKLLVSEKVSIVYTLTRNEFDLSHERLKKIIAKEENFEGSLDGIKIDILIICFGTTIKKAKSKENFHRIDVKLPHIIAKKAINLGASEIHLISSMGAKLNSPSFYLHCKAELEEKIKKLNFGNTFIYRPSVLDGNRKEKRLMEILGINLGNGLKRIKLLKILWPTKVSELTDLICLNLGKTENQLEYYSKFN